MKCLFFISLFFFISCQSNNKLADEDFSNKEYQIGTTYFTWQDKSRKDPYYGGNRVLNIQIWYPIEASKANIEFPESSYYYGTEEIWKQLSGWSKADIEFVKEVKTNALVNAPISQKEAKYPLLIFSPSLGGNLSLYSYYAEKLVEAGFVVVGVNHLYESEFVLNENNEILPLNLGFHDSLKNLQIPDQITVEEYRKVKGQRQKVLGEDLLFCINQLQSINQQTFENRFDFKRIGVWGHSIGGAAAVYAAYLNNQIKAVVDLDGTPPSVALNDGIDVPFLFIEDLTDYENHEGYAKLHKRRNDFCSKNTVDAFRILIGDTNHNSFLDINYHSAPTDAEKQRALEVLDLTTNYMNIFFTKYLNGEKLILPDTKNDSLQIIQFVKE